VMETKQGWKNLWDLPEKSDLVEPLQKAKTNFLQMIDADASIRKEEGEALEVALLLSTGAYSPIHRMHVQMMDIAKDFIENKLRIPVVVGYLSPSTDKYVKNKLKKDYIPAAHRVPMARLAVQDSSWLEISDWESRSTRWGSPTKLLTHQAKYLSEQVDGWLAEAGKSHATADVRPFYVCGVDHAIKYKQWRTGLRKEVVAIGRFGYAAQLRQKMEESGEAQSQWFYLVENDSLQAEVSSTLLRKRLKDGESVDDLTLPAVAAYLKEHAGSIFSGEQQG